MAILLVSASFKTQLIRADHQVLLVGQALPRDARGYSVSPTDSSAEQRCALGAILAPDHGSHGDHCNLLRTIKVAGELISRWATSLTHVNDAEGHAAILNLFDLAIAAQRAVLGSHGSHNPEMHARPAVLKFGSLGGAMRGDGRALLSSTSADGPKCTSIFCHVAMMMASD